jgi:hypothetical protein
MAKEIMSLGKSGGEYSLLFLYPIDLADRISLPGWDGATEAGSFNGPRP